MWPQQNVPDTRSAASSLHASSAISALFPCACRVLTMCLMAPNLTMTSTPNSVKRVCYFKKATEARVPSTFCYSSHVSESTGCFSGHVCVVRVELQRFHESSDVVINVSLGCSLVCCAAVRRATPNAGVHGTIGPALHEATPLACHGGVLYKRLTKGLRGELRGILAN